MTLQDRIHAFVSLGDKISAFKTAEIEELTAHSRSVNGWFDYPSVHRALEGIAFMLKEDKLERWTENYPLDPSVSKIVGIIMAGNIPMVGFHDLLSVLISGHLAAVKMSSQDPFLMQKIIDWVIEIEPRFKKNIDVREKLDAVDAVICTGSDNTARHFEYYFGKYPNLIRRNRTSVAVLNGKETDEELQALGQDIFTYYGLGCRNVSKLFTPEGFDLTTLLPHWEPFQSVIHNNKYKNNYDYNKAIYLINKEEHLDNGFLLVCPSEEIVSPTAVLYHSTYSDQEELESLLLANQEKIQCIVGTNHVPFGQAQSPELWDYADGVDTLDFLSKL